jgi:alpha-beta hydrolase superfamily lysophospholipase
MDEYAIGRRTVLKSAGVGVGLMSGLLTSQAQAQTPASAPSGEIWSGEYWAKKGDVPLNLWRKRVGVPRPGEPPRPVLLLVHGSSNSARSSYDLAVPGAGEYSVMNVFARYGFDVWTLDHENYGKSGRTEGNSDIASGVEDLKPATELIARETGQSRLHMCGTSSGAIRAGAFAMVQPERVDRLVLVAFTYKGAHSPTLAKRAEQVAFYRANNRRLRDRAMIRSIFTRDGAGQYDMRVADALADQELQFGDQTPTGTYLDMTANLPLVDPTKVKAPVLLLRGEHDGIASMDDLYEFYKQLPNGDKQFTVLPNVAHSVTYSKNRHMFWHMMRAFLELPGPVAS